MLYSAQNDIRVVKKNSAKTKPSIRFIVKHNVYTCVLFIGHQVTCLRVCVCVNESLVNVVQFFSTFFRCICRKSFTIQVVVLHSPSSTSAIHTVTRHAKRCSSPQKVCTPASSCTVERKPLCKLATLCHWLRCQKVQLFAIWKKRPATVDVWPEHPEIMPQLLHTIQTHVKLVSSYHPVLRRSFHQPTVLWLVSLLVVDVSTNQS